MKESYLIFNSISGEYSFVDGTNPYDERRRVSLGFYKDAVFEKLKKHLDYKRKTTMHVSKDISGNFLNALSAEFGRSKIQLKLEDKI